MKEIFSMSRWSGALIGLFIPAVLPAQVISEIMYHPREGAGTEDKRYEWLELYNPDPDPIDLSGYRFTKGINFTFPQGTYLTGRSFLVVCANQAAVQAKYGTTGTIGNGDSNPPLNNGGETIPRGNAPGVVIT